MGKVLLTVVVTLALVVAGVVVFAYSGVYDVAATSPHHPATRWLLSTTMDNSIRARAGTVAMPPPLGEAEVRDGAGHFAETCEQCHGAPGVARGEEGKGLTPRPPDLAKAVPEWSDRELFWIVQHGVKFTGMPAFGPTHQPAELWEIVAFLKRLPGMTPEQYQAMKGTRGGETSDRHHEAHNS